MVPDASSYAPVSSHHSQHCLNILKRSVGVHLSAIEVNHKSALPLLAGANANAVALVVSNDVAFVNVGSEIDLVATIPCENVTTAIQTSERKDFVRSPHLNRVECTLHAVLKKVVIQHPH